MRKPINKKSTVFAVLFLWAELTREITIPAKGVARDRPFRGPLNQVPGMLTRS